MRELKASDLVELIEKQVDTIMDTICYMPVEKKGITIYDPKEPAAIEVSQIVDEEISYKVLSYNHHSLKGNIEAFLELENKEGRRIIKDLKQV